MTRQKRLEMESSWKLHLQDEFNQPYMQQLRDFLLSRKRAGASIYPAGENYFRAMALTPFDAVKVVIIGQDPYHRVGQAQGLCFSVPPGVPVPPSLANIYRELEQDLGLQPPTHGCLESWAHQGVLLLNSILTVEDGTPGAHSGRGWEILTDKIVETLDRVHQHLVFLLWGSYAQRKGQMLNREKHLLLTSSHPSPLSAYRGFLGCRHFSRANAWLEQHGERPIDWQLPQLD